MSLIRDPLAQTSAVPSVLRPERSKRRGTTKLQRETDILNDHPLPSHWKAPSVKLSNPFGLVRWFLFNAMCVTAFGHPGLEPLWAAIQLEEEGDESVWDDFARRQTERMNNMLLVAGSLLTTSSVFLSTGPPRPDIVDWTVRASFVCILSAFALMTAAIIFTSIQTLIVGQVRPNWLKEVRPTTPTALDSSSPLPRRQRFNPRLLVL